MAGASIALAAAGFGQILTQAPREPPHSSGQSVTPAYEGWYPNADGTFTILVGYYNRNLKEVLDIPVGPNNRVQPGGPDRGQPTHFLTGRQWGRFRDHRPQGFFARRENYLDHRFEWEDQLDSLQSESPVGDFAV